MTRTLTVALAALSLLAHTASAQRAPTRDAALDQMVAAERAFAKAALDDTQGAFVQWMAADGYLYRPRVVRARAWLGARPMPPGLMLTWEPAYADMSASGDLGYTTGPWISTRRDFPDAPPTFGQYVSLWRRQADGSWKTELNLGVAHEPDPIGAKSLTRAPAPAYRATADGEAHRRSLFNADSALDAAARARRAAPAFLENRLPELRLLRPNRFAIRGDSAINVLRATPTYHWRTAGGGVSRAGDLGYTFGVYSITVPGGRGGETGDYLRIFRRDAKGTWRVVLDATSPTG